MSLPYLPPEQWLALASAALIAVSAATLLTLRRIDRAVTLP